MITTTRSHISPNLIIEHYTKDDFLKAESALRKLNSKNNGRELLNQISSNSTNGKNVKIKVVSMAETTSRPKLTDVQISKYNVSENDTNILHNLIANKISQKKSFWRKGEGVSSTITWNPSIFVKVDSKGKAIKDNDEDKAFVSLAHELVHSYRMLKGTYMGGITNRFKIFSRSGIEESRAVGIGTYFGNPLSENGIRFEHGIRLRGKYSLG